MDKALKWIRHNTPLTVGLVVCVLISIYAYGCDSKGTSVLTPGIQVTRAQLSIEVKQIADRHEVELQLAELSLQEIERKDQFKRKIFEFGATIAQTGEFNSMGLIGLAGWIMGGSSYLNGRKKDVIIARDKSLGIKSDSS